MVLLMCAPNTHSCVQRILLSALSNVEWRGLLQKVRVWDDHKVGPHLISFPMSKDQGDCSSTLALLVTASDPLPK